MTTTTTITTITATIIIVITTKTTRQVVGDNGSRFLLRSQPNEPPARRQNLLSLLDMRLEAPTSIEFVRWTPPLQTIKTIEVEPRENFEFYL